MSISSDFERKAWNITYHRIKQNLSGYRFIKTLFLALALPALVTYLIVPESLSDLLIPLAVVVAEAVFFIIFERYVSAPRQLYESATVRQAEAERQVAVISDVSAISVAAIQQHVTMGIAVEQTSRQLAGVVSQIRRIAETQQEVMHQLEHTERLRETDVVRLTQRLSSILRSPWPSGPVRLPEDIEGFSYTRDHVLVFPGDIGEQVGDEFTKEWVACERLAARMQLVSGLLASHLERLRSRYYSPYVDRPIMELDPETHRPRHPDAGPSMEDHRMMSLGNMLRRRRENASN